MQEKMAIRILWTPYSPAKLYLSKVIVPADATERLLVMPKKLYILKVSTTLIKFCKLEYEIHGSNNVSRVLTFHSKDFE